MPHFCPHCYASLGQFRNRIGVRYSRRPGLAPYQYSAARYTCPNCGVELRRVTQAVGYAIHTLMIIASGAYILFFFLHPLLLLRVGFAATVGFLVLNYVLSAAYMKWGYNDVVAATKTTPVDASL